MFASGFNNFCHQGVFYEILRKTDAGQSPSVACRLCPRGLPRLVLPEQHVIRVRAGASRSGPSAGDMVFAFLNPANSRAGIVKTRGFFVLNIDFFVASLLSLLINTSWKNTENYKHKRLDRNFT